jgi:hypothetical protein
MYVIFDNSLKRYVMLSDLSAGLPDGIVIFPSLSHAERAVKKLQAKIVGPSNAEGVFTIKEFGSTT